MNIALLITGLGMGGAERQVVDLADRFASLDHNILIIYLTGEAIVLPSNPSIRVIGMNMSKTPWSFLTTYRRIRSLIQSFKPDILHSHMVHANIMARLLRLSIRIPRLICTAHNTNEGGTLRMWLYRVTDPLCDLSTNVSQEAVDIFIAKKAAPKGGMIPIYNGIDTSRFHFNADVRTTLRKNAQVSDQEKILLCVGRLNRQKDYPTMLHAFALALEKNKNLILWIAGDGEEKEPLLHLCQKLNITNKVHFLGVRRDIPELMSASDLFCLSSQFEGFGLVVAEAMACERPIVATDCGGVKEIVAKDGILVSPSSPKKLAKAILASLQTPHNSARDRIVKMFSLDVIAQQWINLYTTKKLSEKTT